MKKNVPEANKDGFGQINITTMWAKDDGKPKPLAEGASKEEEEKWTEAMSAWALRGSTQFVDLHVLMEKHSSLSKQRVETSRHYAVSRRCVQAQLDGIFGRKRVMTELQASLEADSDKLHDLDDKSQRLLAKRARIDKEKEETVQQIPDSKKDKLGKVDATVIMTEVEEKPKPLSEGAAKEEVEKWTEAMSAWALRVDLHVLFEKYSSLSKQRLETSRHYAVLRRCVKAQLDGICGRKHAISELQAMLEVDRDNLHNLDDKSQKLLAKRENIDKEKEEIIKKISGLKHELGM
jgi:hypothetical protein